jgi:hypothetical protein
MLAVLGPDGRSSFTLFRAPVPSLRFGVGSSFRIVGSICGDLRVNSAGAPVSFQSRAAGVGSNGEDPVTEVGSADGRSWKTVPDNIKPERGQGLEDFLPDQSLLDGEEVGDILQDDVARSKLAHDSSHLSPQNGLGVIEPVSKLPAC